MKYNNLVIRKVLKKSDILVIALSDSQKMVKALPDNRFSVNCFYHNDKRPSMIVDRKNNHFHCYSCSTHGDVLNLFMKRYNLKFLASIETLAYVFNIKLPRRTYVETDYVIGNELKHIIESEQYKELIEKSFVKTLKNNERKNSIV